MCKSTLNIPAFSKKNNQQLENINSGVKINSETISKHIIKKQESYNNLNTKLLKPCYSKNYLCCYKCRGIPEIIIKNSEEILLNCDFCGFTEKVNINDI